MSNVPTLSLLVRQRIKTVSVALAIVAVGAALASHALAALVSRAAPAVSATPRAEILAAAGVRDGRGAVVKLRADHRAAVLCRSGQRPVLLRHQASGWVRIHTRPAGSDTLLARCDSP